MVWIIYRKSIVFLFEAAIYMKPFSNFFKS